MSQIPLLGISGITGTQRDRDGGRGYQAGPWLPSLRAHRNGAARNPFGVSLLLSVYSDTQPTRAASTGRRTRDRIYSNGVNRCKYKPLREAMSTECPPLRVADWPAFPLGAYARGSDTPPSPPPRPPMSPGKTDRPSGAGLRRAARTHPGPAPWHPHWTPRAGAESSLRGSSNSGKNQKLTFHF